MINSKTLRWGGISGILAAIVFIVGMPLYNSLLPLTSEGLMAFPDDRLLLAVSTLLSMLTAILALSFISVIYRILRENSLILSLFGSIFSIVGYIITALGDASTFIAFAPLSELYHSSLTNPEVQSTIVLLWQTNRGIVNTFFFVGSLFVMSGFIALGFSMFKAPIFGRKWGGVSVLMGLIGVIAVVTGLFISGQEGIQVMGISVFANLIFLPLLGLKVYMSRLDNLE